MAQPARTKSYTHQLSSISIGSHIIIQYIIIIKYILFISAYLHVLWRTWCRQLHEYRVLFYTNAIRGKPVQCEHENAVHKTENLPRNIAVNIFQDVSRSQKLNRALHLFLRNKLLMYNIFNKTNHQHNKIY